MRRREEHMKEQNNVNEEKDCNTQRQETKDVAGREKVDERVIWKIEKKGEIATKPKLVEVRDTKERERQRRITMERNKNRKYL